MKTRLLVMFVTALVAACGDDGVHHLADAPPGLDGPVIDAPPGQVHLVVALGGNGSGTVTSSPDGISCGTTCDATFTQDTVVTLTAVPAEGSVFVGWAGSCSGALPTCDVTLAAAGATTATFALATHTVTVHTQGAGTGTVTGNGLDCGATCTVSVAYGTQISLAASPANLSVFAGWGGACSGNAACTLTITDDTDITASFALDDVTLFISKGGNGAGTVTSTAAGIACGATCMHTYTAGDMVTLTAAPSTGSTFAGWAGGGCTGTGTCTLTMTGATTVTATFTLQTNLLTVARHGPGAGAVSSDPAGIACGADCTETESYGTIVTLTATPGANSTFGGWAGGGCSGTALTCTTTVIAATTVDATFDLVPEKLSIAFAGSGGGEVDGGLLSCTGNCSKDFDYGTMVTLTATPATDAAHASRFAGWTGACTGTGACTVTMTAAMAVTATFTLAPNLMFVSSATSNGNLGGLAGADKLCNDLAAAASFGGTYVAYLSSKSDAGAVVTGASRVGGATGWARPDGKPIMDKIDELTTGLMSPPSMSDKKVDVTATKIAWTGTDKSGGFANQCSVVGKSQPWTDVAAPGASLGDVTSTTPTVISAGTTTCDSVARIYCLGIDRKAQSK